MSTLKIINKTISHCAQNLHVHVDKYMYSTWMNSLSCFPKMAHFNNAHKSKIICRKKLKLPTYM